MMDNDAGEQREVSMREMASLWVQSQSIVSAYISSNVIDHHHAEDLIQETATAVAEKIGAYDPDRPFTPWVLAIARNRVLKYYRTRTRDKHVLGEAALDSLGEAFERVQEESEDRRQALRLCLQKVRGRAKAVLALRYDDGMMVKEIGIKLDITASTVSVILHRVRVSLLECIKGEIARGMH